MSRRFRLSGLALLGILCLPQAASAQAPFNDSVRGAVTADDIPNNSVTLTFDVRSGPTGENATGSVTLDRGAFHHESLVTCLNVGGNRAVVGGRIVTSTEPSLIGWTANWEVVDGGPGAIDAVTLGNISTSGAPRSCDLNEPVSGVAFSPIVSGDLVVVDAQPFPTTKDQCKNAGWRNFGSTFKNQGQCVSFVATGGKKQP